MRDGNYGVNDLLQFIVGVVSLPMRDGNTLQVERILGPVSLLAYL